MQPILLIKPAKYDETTSWPDYKSHFGACEGLRNWNEEEKALYLAVSLCVMHSLCKRDLTGGIPKKYDDLITAKNERFSPPNQM